MNRWTWVLAVGMLPGSAWADCVYTGAKRAYLECIYGSAVDAAAAAAAAAADLVGLQLWAGDVDGSLSGLDTRVGALESEVGTLGPQVQEHGDELVTLDGRYNLMLGQLAVQDTINDDVWLRLEGLEGTTGALDADLTEIDGRYNLLLGQLAVMDAIDDDYWLRLAGLDNTTAELEADVAGLASSVSALQTGQTDLDGDVGALTTAVSGLQSTDATHTARINQLRALENMRALISKTTATSHCPSGTAIHVPIGYAGQTGNQICAADSRGRTTCTSVQYVYVTNENGLGSYDPGNLACSQAVNAPWPWGASSGAPNSYGPEWGHGDTWVVCCN